MYEAAPQACILCGSLSAVGSPVLPPAEMQLTPDYSCTRHTPYYGCSPMYHTMAKYGCSTAKHHAMAAAPTYRIACSMHASVWWPPHTMLWYANSITPPGSSPAGRLPLVCSESDSHTRNWTLPCQDLVRARAWQRALPGLYPGLNRRYPLTTFRVAGLLPYYQKQVPAQ